MMNKDALAQIRDDYRRRYRRRLWWRRFRDVAYQVAVYLGTAITATMLAVAYLAVIAILCGY